MFQKQKFVYDKASGLFSIIESNSHMNKTFDQFNTFEGLDTKGINATTELYGLNIFDIPIPTFKDLMKQHMVAPFFVFQLFCVALWFLDDMWY